MGTISRINDIINSNIQAALDRAEKPEVMVRTLIAEFQGSLAEVRAQAARMIAERRRIERRLRRLQSVGNEWRQKAERALAKGREDLARAALHQKIQLAKTVDEARALSSEAKRSVGQYERQITALAGKLAEARDKLKAMAPRPRPRARQQRPERHGISARVEEALDRLDKIEDRLDDSEGTIKAYDLGPEATLKEELADLEVDDAILAELEAMKRSAKN